MAKRNNFQKAINDAASKWSKELEKVAKKNAPRHIAPHIYTKTITTSSERRTIMLGVKMVDSFSTTSRGGDNLPPGGVSTGGSMDAAVLEFGGKDWYDITPRKRMTKTGRTLKKYQVAGNTWMGVGMQHQRSWLLIPNLGYLPKDAGEGYRPNYTKDGYGIFVKKVHHPPSSAYNNGRGYLRISIEQTKDDIISKEKASIARAIRMDIIEKFTKSDNMIFNNYKDWEY